MVNFKYLLLAVNCIRLTTGFLVARSTFANIARDSVVETASVPLTTSSSIAIPMNLAPPAVLVAVTETLNPTISATISRSTLPIPTCTTTYTLQPQRDKGRTTTVYQSTSTSLVQVYCGGCGISYTYLPYTVPIHVYTHTETRQVKTTPLVVCSTNSDGSIYSGPRKESPHIIEPDQLYSASAVHKPYNWWPWKE